MTGFFEIILVLSIAALVFGYRHVPKIPRYFVDTIKSFRKGLSESDRKVREINPKDSKD